MTPDDIIDYWYSDSIRKYWFSATPELDKIIRDKYEQIWVKASAGDYDEWMNTPEGCLALIIILDQFPLNMYRGKARSFQTEGKAIEVVLSAIDIGFEKIVNQEKLEPFCLCR